ncbi:MAG: hypothetical protein GY772_22800 [bacterium]|nr:hypothetical protein [bacterium]
MRLPRAAAAAVAVPQPTVAGAGKPPVRSGSAAATVAGPRGGAAATVAGPSGAAAAAVPGPRVLGSDRSKDGRSTDGCRISVLW